MAAIYTPNNNHVLKLLYGEAINRPSFFMNINLVYNNRIPNLEAERINTLELNYQTSLFKDAIASVSIYRNKLHNLIYRLHNFENSKYSTFMTNLGEMTAIGAEIQLKAKLSKQFEVEMSAVLQEVDDKNLTNTDVAFSPNLLGYFRSSYQFDLLGYQSNISITCNYVDDMEAQWDATPEDITDPESPPVGRVGNRANSYINFGVNYRVENLLAKNTYCNLRLTNLFNEDIYFPTNTNQSWANKGTLDAGRFVQLKVGWEF